MQTHACNVLWGTNKKRDWLSILIKRYFNFGSLLLCAVSPFKMLNYLWPILPIMIISCIIFVAFIITILRQNLSFCRIMWPHTRVAEQLWLLHSRTWAITWQIILLSYPQAIMSMVPHKQIHCFKPFSIVFNIQIFNWSKSCKAPTE